MQQHELRQPAGATHKRKRVGRGNASGHGTYSTKGMKGQKARSGGGVRVGFEGGQLPFIRRMARKRGFRNAFRVDYEEVNIAKLALFSAGTAVTVDALREARLVRGSKPVKILGNGDLGVALTVTADSFSAAAKSKIEAAGGSIVWVGGEPLPKEERTPKRDKKNKAKAAAAAKASDAKAPKDKPATKDEPAAEAEEEANDVAGS